MSTVPEAPPASAGAEAPLPLEQLRRYILHRHEPHTPLREALYHSLEKRIPELLHEEPRLRSHSVVVLATPDNDVVGFQSVRVLENTSLDEWMANLIRIGAVRDHHHRHHDDPVLDASATQLADELCAIDRAQGRILQHDQLGVIPAYRKSGARALLRAGAWKIARDLDISHMVVEIWHNPTAHALPDALRAGYELIARVRQYWGPNPQVIQASWDGHPPPPWQVPLHLQRCAWCGRDCQCEAAIVAVRTPPRNLLVAEGFARTVPLEH